MKIKAKGWLFTGLMMFASSFTMAAAPVQFYGSLDSAIDHAKFVRAMRLQGELFHVQGIAIDTRRIWVTSIDNDRKRGYVHLFDRATGQFLRRIDVTDGIRYHPGGISLSGGSLWVPVAELRPDSSAVLLEIDADSMQVRRKIAVADHIGCVAASGNRLVAGNWDSKLLYQFNLARKGPPRIVANPSSTHFQDMKLVGNTLVASGSQGWWNGTLDWIDLTSNTVMRSLRAGAVSPIRAWTGEGMAIEGRDVYLLPEDGPSRLFHFRLDE